MGDINLTNPLSITLSAIKITTYTICIKPDSIQVNLNYYNIDDTLIKSEIFNIIGADYDQLVNTEITDNMVGKVFIDVIERGIRNKVKQLKHLSGTISISI